jgi:hypothetical protein
VVCLGRYLQRDHFQLVDFGYLLCEYVPSRAHRCNQATTMYYVFPRRCLSSQGVRPPGNSTGTLCFLHEPCTSSGHEVSSAAVSLFGATPQLRVWHAQ